MTWGGTPNGGDSSGVSAQLTSVEVIQSSQQAFAAKKMDGTVITWGHSSYGGDSSGVSAQLVSVDVIYSNPFSFAARMADGTAIAWGHSSYWVAVKELNLSYYIGENMLITI